MSAQGASEAHEACLTLLRAYFADEVDQSLADVFRRTDPEELVRVATFAYLHTVFSFIFEKNPKIAEVIDDDAVVYLHEMRRENRRRNTLIMQQIRVVGDAFAKLGIKAVALKGAAELLAPANLDTGRRFLSDIDLLVDVQDAAASRQALAGLGAVAERKDDGHLFGKHHLAPFWHDDWLVPVELHVSTGRTEIEMALPAENILASAEDIGPGLCVPTQAQRIAHLVLHAQFSNQRWARAQLSPRDLLEAALYQQQFGADAVAQASEVLSMAGRQAANDDFWNAVDTLCLKRSTANPWTKRALNNYVHPERQSEWLIKDRIAQMAQTFVHSSSGRRRYLRSALSGRAWRGLVREFAALRHRAR